MKKLFAILLATMLLLSTVACASKIAAPGSAQFNMGSSAQSAPMTAEKYEEYGYDYDYGYEYEVAYDVAAPMDSNGVGSGSGLSSSLLSSSGSGMLSEKIIYSANAYVETTEYDESIKVLADMLAKYNGFIENSYEDGYETYDYNNAGARYTLRNASYTIRIPSEHFNTFTDGLSAVGNVRNRSTDAVNVTEQYTDYESRLNAYRIQEERLLSMLEKADNIPDMITIESNLSDVRYNIEYITSNLRNLSNRVNYSSVYINLQEVQKYTPVVPINLTYWEQIGEGLKQTVAAVGNFFKGLFRYIIVLSPVLLILAVVIVIVVLIVRRNLKKNRERGVMRQFPAKSDKDDADSADASDANN